MFEIWPVCLQFWNINKLGWNNSHVVLSGAHFYQGGQKGRIGREGSIGGQVDSLGLGVTFNVLSVTAIEEAANAGAAFVVVWIEGLGVLTTSIDATEAIDEADVEEMVDAEAAAVVVVGEIDGIATETVADGASADLEV